MPFLQLTIIQTAASHFRSVMGDSSKIVPVLRLNCGRGCFS